MKTITFPEWGIQFTVSRVAFTIGNIEIYWYAIFIVLAILIAIYGCYRKSGRYQIEFNTIMDLLIWTLPISFIGARIFYVVFALEQFQDNWLAIFNFKTGGMAIYGGILAGAVTIYFFCKNKKISFLDVLDYIVPYLALRTGDWKMGKLY